MKYAIWNNKGGVGKTFLSFALATEWAHNNPDGRVLVVDMCPQANISEILLGGNGSGHTHILQLIEQQKTIGGYFDTRIRSPHEKTGDAESFVTLVSEINPEIPSNLYLIAGDPSLELQVQTINNIAVLPLPQNSWENVHNWVKDLIDGYIEENFENRKTLCIIDCNPSFASYTEQALLAADRLIVPCSPDGSSARAVNNLARLVYGINTPKMYQEVGFYKKAKQFQMMIPKLHMAVLNRSTTYRSKASIAFKAMGEQVEKNVVNFVNQLDKQYYTDGASQVQNMPDVHTASVVATSRGKPFYQLKPQRYELSNGEKPTLNKEQLGPYKDDLSKIVGAL